MTVAFVCHEYPPRPHGGIGSMVQTMGRAMVEAGHQVRVLGLSPDVRTEERFSDLGVDVVVLPEPVGKLGWVQGRRQIYKRLSAWANEGAIDVIEVPDWQGPAAHWPALSVPVVSRLHGSSTYFAAEMGRTATWITRHLESRSLRRADFICAVSQYTAQRTQHIFGRGAASDMVLPNMIALAPMPPAAARRPGQVVFSGTLSAKKGVIALIDAWSAIATEFPWARLDVYGGDGRSPDGGSMAAFLQSRLRNAAAASVTFHGRVPRAVVGTALRAAPIAVFPSFAEAFPIAPLEAMAAGCATIASSLGAGPEQIDHGVDGLSVDPHHPQQISQALRQLLLDPDRAAQLGRQGRARVERSFSLGRLLPANIDFYRSCVAAHDQRRALASQRWSTS